MKAVLKYKKVLNRPFIKVGFQGDYTVDALIDTGASVGVTALSEEVLINKFNGILVSRNNTVKGIGSKIKLKGDIFKIDLLIGGIIFKSIPVLRSDESEEVLLLPATMFLDFKLTIDSPNELVIIENNSNQVSYDIILKVGDKALTVTISCYEYNPFTNAIQKLIT